jgi:hypothetical protein
MMCALATAAWRVEARWILEMSSEVAWSLENFGRCSWMYEDRFCRVS